MIINKVITIGYNCACTIVGRELNVVKELNVFDWGFSAPLSICKVLSSLYIDGEEYVLNKLLSIKDGYTHKNFCDEYCLYYPHYSIESLESKLSRRLKRMKDTLSNSDINVLFLYTSPSHPSHEFDFGERGCLTRNPYDDLVKLFKIIRLFRPEDTFRIAFIDSSFDDSKTEWLNKHGIDYLPGPQVEEEKFWIHPCIHALSDKYIFDIK